MEVARVGQRYALARQAIPPALWIVSLWVPLQAVQPIADTLAGQDTSLSVTFSVTIGISIALGAGMMALLGRSRGQRAELLRLRKRCVDLEQELGERETG